MRLDTLDLAALRRPPGPECGETLGPNMLRHCDEQSLACLVALGNAFRQMGRDPKTEVGEFREWGVVAGPRRFGLSALMIALGRIQAEGAWGISPHLVPHRSLHALSGLISQVLRINGPNLGVGGSPDAHREAMLASLTLLQSQTVPGVLLVTSRIVGELPVVAGNYPETAEVEAVALVMQQGAGPIDWQAEAFASEFTFERLVSLVDSLQKPQELLSFASGEVFV
jgi:hypothetical protein